MNAELTFYGLAESTPGYMPDSEPLVVLGLGAAREAAGELLRSAAEDCGEYVSTDDDYRRLLGLAAAAGALPAEGEGFYFDHPSSPGLGRVLTVEPVEPGSDDEAELLTNIEAEELLLAAAGEAELDYDADCYDLLSLLYRLRSGPCDGLGTLIGSRGYTVCSGCSACKAAEAEAAEEREREQAESPPAPRPATDLESEYRGFRLRREPVYGLAEISDAEGRVLESVSDFMTAREVIDAEHAPAREAASLTLTGEQVAALGRLLARPARGPAASVTLRYDCDWDLLCELRGERYYVTRSGRLGEY